MNESNEWYDEGKEVSLEDVKALAEKLDVLDLDYKTKKKASSEAKAEADMVRAKIIAILKEAGLTKFHAPNVGMFSVSYTPTIKTPKSFEEKEAFFDYLKSKGKDMYLTYASVNSASLNTLFKAEMITAAEAGEAFEMPGCEIGATLEKLSFRRGK